MKCKNCGQPHEVTVNRQYNVPYGGGYNPSGDTIYINSRLPSEFTDTQHQQVQVLSYLVIHEVVEKALMNYLGFSYNHAHSIAMGAEMHACTMDRVNYDEYYGFMEKYIKYDIKPEDFDNVPPDLDITPYIEDGLTEVVDKILKLQEDINGKE